MVEKNFQMLTKANKIREKAMAYPTVPLEP